MIDDDDGLDVVYKENSHDCRKVSRVWWWWWWWWWW